METVTDMMYERSKPTQKSGNKNVKFDGLIDPFDQIEDIKQMFELPA